MALKDLLDRFKKGLARTARLFDVRAWLGRKVDQSFLDQLEAKLIQADLGVASTRTVIGKVRDAYADKTADEDLIAFVKAEFRALLADPTPATFGKATPRPMVYLVAGINGSGKTTSIAKLAQRTEVGG